MPTTFIGLFLFSTALSLIATFTVLAVLAVVRHVVRLVAPSPDAISRVRPPE